MARDVEINVTASDRTGMGLAAAERRLKQTSDRVKSESDRVGNSIAKSVVKMVEEVSPKAAKALAGAFASAGEMGGPLLVAGIAAAAPLVAATVSAAIIAGAAIGAVGIGVALVAQDARVKAAGEQLGASLMDGLHQDASSFIRPVLDGIDLIEDRFAESRTVIKSIMDSASKFVIPLVDGATRGVQGILRGVDALVANAGPVIDSISDGLDQLGNDFGDFMEEIAGNGEDAAAALDLVFNTLGKILDITGPLIGGLTKVFGFLEKFGIVSGILSTMTGPIGMVADAFDDTAEKTDKAAGAAGGMALEFQKSSAATDAQQAAAAALSPSMQQMTADIGAATSANRALYGSETDVSSALADATGKLRENGKTHSLATEKGRENRRVLEQLAGTLSTNYQNFVKLNGATDASSAKGDSLRASFLKVAEGAGYGARQARRLADEILGIPDHKTVTITLDANITNAYRRVHDNADNLRFDSAGSFAFAGQGSGSFRSGGATPPTVNNAFDVVVNVDGNPLRSSWQSDIREANGREAFRRRVGQR